MFAAALGVRGLKVDIVTSSPILARRDAKTWAEFYGTFGLTVADNTRTKALLESSNSDELLTEAYKSSVVYGTILSFSGDVLREVFSLDEIRSNRGFQAVIVDEVDMLMMDEGISLTYLSHCVPVLRHIEPVIALVWSAVKQNTPYYTEDEKILYAGTTDYFNNVVLDRIEIEDFAPKLHKLASQVNDEGHIAHKLEKFFDAEDEHAKKVAIEMFDLQDMLTVILLLNSDDLACNITVYNLVEDGILESVEQSDHHDSTPKIYVVLQDRGMVSPLYNLHELEKGIKEMIMNKLGISNPESDPEVVLKTEDGTMYCPGTPGYIPAVLSKCLRPVHILHLMAKANIATTEVNEFFEAQDKDAQLRAFASFKSKDIHNILSELDKLVAHNLVVYVPNDYDCKRLKQIQKSRRENDTTPILLMDEGKVCILQDVQDDNDESVLQALDGQRFVHGPVDYFHNVVFKSMYSSDILRSLVLLDGTIEFDQMLEAGEVLQLLSHLKNYLKLNFAAYKLKDDDTLVRDFSSGASDTNQSQVALLVLEDGIICRLHPKQTVEIPHFMKESEFVKNQLPVYIRNAFHALSMTEKREYLVSDDGSIHPIDFENTGIVQTNRTWSGGLQQMLEMKHNIQVSPVSVITNFLSHVGFFKRYSKGTLYGLSGTIGTDSDCEILKDPELYDFCVSRIPTYKLRLLYERETIIVEGETEDWLDRIHSVLEDVTGKKDYTTPLAGAAALVLCEDIRSADLIRAHLSKKHLATIPYTRNDLNQCDKFEDVERKPGDIIVATNLAGRGTDIKVSHDVNVSGGLFILLTFLPRNRRVELQAFGRTARQGRPGSVQCILQASSLPIEYQEFVAMNDIRKLRENQESSRLRRMLDTDVKGILFKEDLFDRHCKFLSEIRLEVKEREDRQLRIDAINEHWGEWLEMKEAEIDDQNETLRYELELAHEEWRPQYPDPNPDVPFPLPKCNFYHLVKFGNHCLFKKGGKINSKRAEKAYNYYSDAIRVESKFTMIPYYNRACCIVVIGKEDFWTDSIRDLKKAKELLQVYLDEVYITHQCALLGGGQPCRDEKISLTKQLEVRIQILQHFGKTIDETIDELKKLKGDAKVVATSILRFIPKADNIVTNKELRGLRQLGLEVSFTVEKKKRFNWQAFGIFLLGIGQVIVGVGIAVLSAGTLTSVGIGLITEGVSDIIEGVQGMITGEFDIKDWAISKACSIAISVACGGVGKFIARGAKAAVNGIKAAKGFRSGAKALAKGAKVAVKRGGKAAGKEAKAMWKVAKSGGTITSANLKNAGKLVGKELVLQGAMRCLSKLEDKVIERMFARIGEAVTEAVKPSLRDSFDSQYQDCLGYYVDIFTAQEDIESFFEKKTDLVVESLLKNDSTSESFDKCVNTLRDNIIPGLSSRLKGKAAGVLAAIEAGFVAQSVHTVSQQLTELNSKFVPKLVEQCRGAVKDREVGEHYEEMYNHDELQELKVKLVESTAKKFGQAVTSLLQQNLSWALSRGLSKTVNKVASGHMSKKLKLQETKSLVKAGAQSNFLRYASPTPDKKINSKQRQAMSAHADHILDEKNSGTITELSMAKDMFNCKVVIVDKDRKRKGTLEPSSGAKDAPEVTLMHHSKSEHPPHGHYDVIINGKLVPITSVGNSCMFEAFARGLKDHDLGIAKPANGLDVRKAIHEELTSHPEKWHGHYQRKEQLQKMQTGDFLLEGGGKRDTGTAAKDKERKGAHKKVVQSANRKRPTNKSTAIKVGDGTYARVMLDKTVECVSYKAKNGLEVMSVTQYDRKPQGRIKELKRSCVPGKHTGQVIEKDVNMVAMHVEAKNCNFASNVGRCMFTQPSFKQIAFSAGDRDPNSSPVSFHLVPSEAGANAGTFFGNSVVTSEHYNRKEAVERERIKRFVDNHYGEHTPPERRNFTCRVRVQFEDLIPPGQNAMNRFIQERNKTIRDADKKVPLENVHKLSERFERVGQIATTGLKQGDRPQVQRVKSMVYEVELPNRQKQVSPDLGRDYELYVHSGLHAKPSQPRFNNEDLERARPSNKQRVVAPPA